MSRGRQPERFLATILFTDMVGSTDLAAELGDREWRRVVASHHRTVREQLRRFGGHEVDTAGDGFLAWFDQPAQAVRAADAILAAVGLLQLSLRAGVHTGECERVGGKVGGIAVHIAARVMAAAQADEVLVSSTVRDLVQGSGLAFDDRGSRELKGVPGEWHLFAVVRAPVEVVGDPARSGAAAAASVAAAAAIPDNRRRRWPLVAAVVGILLLIGAAATALGLGILNAGPPPVAAAMGSNSVVTVDRQTGVATEVRSVPAGPVALAVGEGRVWVGSLDAGVVTSLPLSGTGDTQTIGRAGQPTGLALGNGFTWVADAFDKVLTVVDSNGGDEIETLEPLLARQIAYGFGAPWVTDDIDDVVRRLDARTGETLATVDVGAGAYPGPLAAGSGAVWVGNVGTSTIARIDPATNIVVAGAIPLRAVPSGLAASIKDVWIISRAGDVLLRLDPAANAVAATIAAGDQPAALAADGETVWVGVAGTHELVHYAHDGSELSRTTLAGEPTAIAIDGDRVFIALRQE